VRPAQWRALFTVVTKEGREMRFPVGDAIEAKHPMSINWRNIAIALIDPVVSAMACFRQLTSAWLSTAEITFGYFFFGNGLN
jgi:hypothetical protein